MRAVDVHRVLEKAIKIANQCEWEIENAGQSSLPGVRNLMAVCRRGELLADKNDVADTHPRVAKSSKCLSCERTADHDNTVFTVDRELSADGHDQRDGSVWEVPEVAKKH